MLNNMETIKAENVAVQVTYKNGQQRFTSLADLRAQLIGGGMAKEKVDAFTFLLWKQGFYETKTGTQYHLVVSQPKEEGGIIREISPCEDCKCKEKSSCCGAEVIRAEVGSRSVCSECGSLCVTICDRCNDYELRETS